MSNSPTLFRTWSRCQSCSMRWQWSVCITTGGRYLVLREMVCLYEVGPGEVGSQEVGLQEVAPWNLTNGTHPLIPHTPGECVRHDQVYRLIPLPPAPETAVPIYRHGAGSCRPWSLRGRAGPHRRRVRSAGHGGHAPPVCLAHAATPAVSGVGSG